MKQYGKLDIHSRVVVNVTRIEDYAVFVEKDGIPGLIQITDLSWSDNARPQEVLRVGDLIEAKITMIDLESSRKEKFRASIKALSPQEDPWKDPGIFSVGKIFKGSVAKETPFGHFIQITDGVHALLPLKDDNSKNKLVLNSIIKVKIEKIDMEFQKIEVSRIDI